VTKGLASITLGFALVACVSPDSTVYQATRTDSAGVEVILNSGPDRQLAWGFEKVLSVGGADEGAESFFRVVSGGLSFDLEGRIYVLDAGNRRVQVFDETGLPINSIGREGMGPGEFQFPVSLTVYPDGTLLVFDAMRRVGMHFDSVGNFLDQASSPGSFLGGAVRLQEDGLLYSSRRLNRDTGVRYFHVTRVSAKDTTDLFRTALPETANITYEECGINISLPPVFAVPPSWESHGSTTVVSQPPDYLLRVFSGASETMHVLRDLDPPLATRELAILDLGEGEKWQVGTGPDCIVDPGTVIEKRGISNHVPLISQVAVSWSGGLWAQRKVPGKDTGPIDVFDKTGEYLGTLPEGTPWPSAFGPAGRILVLEEDELGVQQVVVYEVTSN
jgi:hypothetical protein